MVHALMVSDEGFGAISHLFSDIISVVLFFGYLRLIS